MAQRAARDPLVELCQPETAPTSLAGDRSPTRAPASRLGRVSVCSSVVGNAVRDEARSQVVLRCLETEESDGVWLTECHPFVTTDELVDYLTDPTKGSGVFRHKRLPVFVVPKQWTDSGASPEGPPEVVDE